MNIKHCIILLITFLCIPAMHGQNEQAHQSPFIGDPFAAKAPSQNFSQEELDHLIALIRAIAEQKNIKLESDDLILQAELRLICKQIHEQTGKLLTPAELFNSMNEACESIATWNMFCSEHELDPMTPMELFEHYVDAQKEIKKTEASKLLLVGAGACIGVPGGIAVGVRYADPIKNALKTGGIYAFSQLAENHAQFTQQIPLTPKQRFALNCSLDAVVSIGMYHTQSHQSKNPAIINTINRAINPTTTQNTNARAALQFLLNQNLFLRTALQYVNTQNTNVRIALQHVIDEAGRERLPVLAKEQVYTVNKKDYGLLILNAIAKNAIDIIPGPDQDAVYLELPNGTITLLSKKILARAAKESGKEATYHLIASQLNSNQSKKNDDPSKITPGIKDIGRIIALTSAKEIGYSVVSQVAHKKIAPRMNEGAASLLQDFFPADGVPKNEMQEFSRFYTIAALTWGASTALTLAKKAINSNATKNALAHIFSFPLV